MWSRWCLQPRSTATFKSKSHMWPRRHILGKSPEVLGSKSVKGAGRDDVKETLPQLFQGFFLTAHLQFVSDCRYCWPQSAITEENLPFGDAHTCARTGRCSRLWPPHLGHLGWVLHSLPLPQCRGQWRRSSPVPAQKDVHNHGMFLNLWHLQGCSIVTARFFSINNQLSQGFVDHRVKEGQVMELYGPGKQHADEGLIH